MQTHLHIRFPWLQMVFLVLLLTAAIGCDDREKPVEKGNRLLGIAVTESENKDFDGAMALAKDAGIQVVSLKLDWDDVEKEPGALHRPGPKSPTSAIRLRLRPKSGNPKSFAMISTPSATRTGNGRFLLSRPAILPGARVKALKPSSGSSWMNSSWHGIYTRSRCNVSCSSGLTMHRHGRSKNRKNTTASQTRRSEIS